MARKAEGEVNLYLTCNFKHNHSYVTNIVESTVISDMFQKADVHIKLKTGAVLIMWFQNVCSGCQVM